MKRQENTSSRDAKVRVVVEYAMSAVCDETTAAMAHAVISASATYTGEVYSSHERRLLHNEVARRAMQVMGITPVFGAFRGNNPLVIRQSGIENSDFVIGIGDPEAVLETVLVPDHAGLWHNSYGTRLEYFVTIPGTDVTLYRRQSCGLVYDWQGVVVGKSGDSVRVKPLPYTPFWAEWDKVAEDYAHRVWYADGDEVILLPEGIVLSMEEVPNFRVREVEFEDDGSAYLSPSVLAHLRRVAFGEEY